MDWPLHQHSFLQNVFNLWSTLSESPEPIFHDEQATKTLDKQTDCLIKDRCEGKS